MVIERGRLPVTHRYRNPGDAAVAGAEVEPKIPRTSHVFSHGDDFPKRIATKSALVSLVWGITFLFPVFSCFPDLSWYHEGRSPVPSLSACKCDGL